MRERKRNKAVEVAENSVNPTGRRKNEKKERTTRFTVLDFFFLVILLLCILGIGFRSTIADFLTEAEPVQEVTISVRMDGLTAEQVNCMRTNDAFTLNGEAFGHLTSFFSEAQKKVEADIDENGEAVFVEVVDPNLFSVNGTITVKGYYAKEGLFVGENTGLCVGKTLKIDASSYSVTVTITEIPRK